MVHEYFHYRGQAILEIFQAIKGVDGIPKKMDQPLY
jgi:hypothetical protein